MSVGWLYFKWWQDREGRVWIWHDCAGVERIEPLETGTWSVVDGRVQPSVDCRECGKHTNLTAGDRIDPPPHWIDPAGEGRTA